MNSPWLRRCKKQFKSKTILFSWFVMVIGILEANLHLIQDYLGGAYGFVFMGIAVISGTMRIFTTQSLDDK